MKTKAIYNNCNACGRTLIRDDELAIGACAICANEKIEPPEPARQNLDTLQREADAEHAKAVELSDKLIDARRSNAELSAQVERLREALQRVWDKDECGYVTNGGSLTCVKCGFSTTTGDPKDIKHHDRCTQGFIAAALSLTPSDALKEYMKPWVEFVELANQKLKFLLDECDWEGDERIPLAFDGMQDQARNLLASIGK